MYTWQRGQHLRFDTSFGHIRQRCTLSDVHFSVGVVCTRQSVSAGQKTLIVRCSEGGAFVESAVAQRRHGRDQPHVLKGVQFTRLVKFSAALSCLR